MAANLTGIATILANIRAQEGMKPVMVKLPSPPRLEGALSPNDWLSKAQTYALNRINGPESLVVVNQYIYTGLKDGWIVEIQPSGWVRRITRIAGQICAPTFRLPYLLLAQQNAPEDACGRPLGLRADPWGYLIVADAYNGIFRVNTKTGRFKHLVDSRTLKVKGQPLGYINDLTIARDGTIFFTSSSNKWKPSQLLNIILEGETTGRVLVYKEDSTLPLAQRVQELVANLHYPNGLQLSKDESYLLIAEGGRSRIFRAWIRRGTDSFGRIDTFAENLPGVLDNIRLSPRNTYWVGVSRARHEKLPSVLDTHGDNPEVRAKLISLANKNMIFDEPHFGMVVELDSNGNLLRSLQDPEGRMYTAVSEVDEVDNVLYIAAQNRNFIGIIDLGTLPQPSPPTPKTGTGSHVINLPSSSSAGMELQNLLVAVKNRMKAMNQQQTQALVVALVKRLFETRMEARNAEAKVTKLQSEIERFQELMGISNRPSGGGVTTLRVEDSTPTGPDAVNTTTSASTTKPHLAVVVPPDQTAVPALGGSVDTGAKHQDGQNSTQTLFDSTQNGQTSPGITVMFSDTTTTAGTTVGTTIIAETTTDDTTQVAG